MYLVKEVAGFMLFVFGLAIVDKHNLIGGGSMILGLRLFVEAIIAGERERLS